MFPRKPLQMPALRSPDVHGWYIVAALSLVLMLNSGLVFYNLPVLINAFVVERSFSVGIASGATAVFFIASGLAGLLAGQLVDRFDVRFVIICSASANAVVFASLVFVNEGYLLYFFCRDGLLLWRLRACSSYDFNCAMVR